MLRSLFRILDVAQSLLAPLPTKPANRLHSVWLES